MRNVDSVIVTVGLEFIAETDRRSAIGIIYSLCSMRNQTYRNTISDKGTIFIYGLLPTTGSTITIRGNKRMFDMSKADYATGTITTIANADETVTGSGSLGLRLRGTHIRINRRPETTNGMR